MKALVTGVAGFIGSHLAAALLDKGADGRRRGLLHRLLSARDQGAQSRRTSCAQGFRFAKTTIQDADLPALLDGVTHVFHLAAQAGVRKSWGKDFTDLHRQQHRGDAAAARGLRRTAARALRPRVELVGVRGSRRDPDARGRAAAAGLALRRHEAGGRAARLPVPRQLRRARRGDAVLHRLRPAPASRHGVQPLHPRGAQRTSRSRSTATANRRATSRSWPTRSRPRSPPASAASPGAPTTSAAARACR